MIPTKSLAWKMTTAFCAMCAFAVAGQEAAQAQTPQTSGPVLEQRHPRYVLQRSDVLYVSFPLAPELNQTDTIQPDGYVNLLDRKSVV